jgi:hypothetical protein
MEAFFPALHHNPLGDVEGYLKSQKGGANTNYKRPDA